MAQSCKQDVAVKRGTDKISNMIIYYEAVALNKLFKVELQRINVSRSIKLADTGALMGLGRTHAICTSDLCMIFYPRLSGIFIVPDQSRQLELSFDVFIQWHLN